MMQLALSVCSGSLDDLRNPEFVAAPLNLPAPFHSRGGADGSRHGCARGQRVPGASSNSTRTTVCVTSISVDRQSLQKMAREKSEHCRTNKHSDLCSLCCRRVLFRHSSWRAPSLAFIDQSNSRYEGYGLRPFSPDNLDMLVCAPHPIDHDRMPCDSRLGAGRSAAERQTLDRSFARRSSAAHRRCIRSRRVPWA